MKFDAREIHNWAKLGRIGFELCEPYFLVP